MEVVKVLVLVLAVVCISYRAHGKATLRLMDPQSRIPGKYFVVLKESEDVHSFTRSLESSHLRTPSAGKIGHKYQHALNGFAATLSKEVVNHLLESEKVEYIEEDGIGHIEAISSWGLGRIDQRSLPFDSTDPSYIGNDGHGTHVWIFDTGVRNTHTDFTGRIGIGWDFEGGNSEDCQGHGTHVTGTAVGSVYGVAPQATLHPIRAYNCQGSGLNSDLIAGMEWVISKVNSYSNNVASMSVGTGVSTAVNAAAKSMYDAGILVIVAAGNQATDACNRSPGSEPTTINVAASTQSDDKLSASNFGSCIDIFAPGKTIASDYKNSDTSAVYWSGTSMACPHVSGAAALLLGQYTSMTPEEIKEQLLASASTGKISTSTLNGSPNKLLYIGTSDQCMPNCNRVRDGDDMNPVTEISGFAARDGGGGDINPLPTEAAFWEDIVL